jgi:Kef-type K+ transport system membrane component KefB
MLFAAAALFLLIRSYGEGLAASAGPAGGLAGRGAAAISTRHDLLDVLVALASVVILGRLLAVAFRVIHEPPVIGEVVAGILLGPSLLGRAAPELAAHVLPTTASPLLGFVAQLGVVLYMFLVGLELNTDLVRGRTHAIVAMSHASMVVPFLLGSALSLYLYPRFGTADVPFTSFALFVGAAMSITAFPVLARILEDRAMQQTTLGATALTCAAADDVTAWCLVAVVVGYTRGRTAGSLTVAALAIAFVAFAIFIVRPALRVWLAAAGTARDRRNVTGLVLAGVIVSALATEWIGVHAIVGAFLFGVVMPRDAGWIQRFREHVQAPVTGLLLPAFFALTGMRTEIGLVSGGSAWLACVLVVLVATAGKFGGTLLAARMSGLPWRDATSLGILMNTRGLMELIVLNIGLDLGIISPTLFTVMVLMALVTTIATTPALDLAGVLARRVPR